MLLISAARHELLKVHFLDARAVQLEWDAVVFFEMECRKLHNMLLFFERVNEFNCPREQKIFIDDTPFRNLVKILR